MSETQLNETQLNEIQWNILLTRDARAQLRFSSYGNVIAEGVYPPWYWRTFTFGDRVEIKRDRRCWAKLFSVVVARHRPALHFGYTAQGGRKHYVNLLNLPYIQGVTFQGQVKRRYRDQYIDMTIDEVVRKYEAIWLRPQDPNVRRPIMLYRPPATNYLNLFLALH